MTGNEIVEEDPIKRLIQDGYISKVGRGSLKAEDFSAYVKSIIFNYEAISRDGMLTGRISAPKSTAADLYKLSTALRAARQLPARIQLDIDLGGFAHRVEKALKELPDRTNSNQNAMAIIDVGLRFGREYGQRPWMWQRPLKARLPADAPQYFSIIGELVGALDEIQADEQDFRRAWENYRKMRTHQTP